MCGICDGPCSCDIWLDPDVLGISPEEEDAIFSGSRRTDDRRGGEGSGMGASAYSRSARRSGLTNPHITTRAPRVTRSTLALQTGPVDAVSAPWGSELRAAPPIGEPPTWTAPRVEQRLERVIEPTPTWTAPVEQPRLERVIEPTPTWGTRGR